MLRGSKSKAKHAVTVQNWSPHFSPPLTQRRETAIIVGVAAVPSTAASGASPPQQDYSSNRGGSVSSRRVEHGARCDVFGGQRDVAVTHAGRTVVPRLKVFLFLVSAKSYYRTDDRSFFYRNL
uniref:Uncharacterized protein n=1 Tax=Oryza nivara TaxID=4536 RepID=A0A0E0I096_ORYNI